MALSPQTLNDLVGRNKTLEDLILQKDKDGNLDETTKAVLFSIIALTQVAIETNVITFTSVTHMTAFLKQNPGFANTLMRVQNTTGTKKGFRYFTNGQFMPLA